MASARGARPPLLRLSRARRKSGDEQHDLVVVTMTRAHRA